MELRRAELERDNAMSRVAQALDVLGATLGDATLQIASLDGALEETLTVPALAFLMARLEEPASCCCCGQIAVQRAQLDVVHAQRTPDVNLDLFYRRIGDSDNVIDVGVRLPLRLFDRGQGRLEATRAELAAAEARARTIRNEQSLRLQAAHRKLARAVAAATVLRGRFSPAQTVSCSGERATARGYEPH